MNNSLLHWQSSKKNKLKVLRTFIQIFICIFLSNLFINPLLFPKKYQAPDQMNWTQTNGFIALSYGSVTRDEKKWGITQKNLDQHLKSLSELGYVTIGSEDIINFYENSTPLPDKALYLIFEDGKKESLLYIQPLLEKYNFKATMMTFAHNTINNDRSFLKSKNLKSMLSSQYFEIGSTGYRYSHINTPLQTSEITNAKKIYNHYLTDYFRDEDGIPVESIEEMTNRIHWDYDQINQIHTQFIKHQPTTYMMMPANSLYQNVIDPVANANLEKIKQYYDLLFSENGSCYNSTYRNPHQLTKLKVDSNWSSHDLLQEIERYSVEKKSFYFSDSQPSTDFETRNGSIELDQTTLNLSTSPSHHATSLLKGSEIWSDIKLSVYLSGTELGIQNIYLRHDPLNQTYIKLTLINNSLMIYEQSSKNKEKLLAHISLPSFETLFNRDFAHSVPYSKTDQRQSNSKTLDLSHYIFNNYQLNNSTQKRPLSYKLDLTLVNNKLSLVIGDEMILNEIEIDPTLTVGSVTLEAIGKNNETYIAVFDQLTIQSIN